MYELPKDSFAARSAANTENLGKFVRDFQAKQFKDAAIVSAPGIAMAASRARQQSVARANESLAQQQETNRQLWIQNQLLSGRSMQDIQAQLDANDAAASRQQQANAAASETSSARLGAVLICGVLSIFLSTRVIGMATWPATLIWVGIPAVLLIGWLALLHVATPPARHSAATESSPAEDRMGDFGSDENVHEQWLSAFRTEQVARLKDRPADEA
jgi:hypothetical protein